MPKARATQLKQVRRPEDIPSFASEDEEARFWSEHELSGEMLERMQPLGEDVAPPAPARTRPVSVRFDEDMLQRLRAMASRRGKRYQTLLKQFVLERLYEEERREGTLPRRRSAKRR